MCFFLDVVLVLSVAASCRVPRLRRQQRRRNDNVFLLGYADGEQKRISTIFRRWRINVLPFSCDEGCIDRGPASTHWFEE